MGCTETPTFATELDLSSLTVSSNTSVVPLLGAVRVTVGSDVLLSATKVPSVCVQAKLRAFPSGSRLAEPSSVTLRPGVNDLIRPRVGHGRPVDRATRHHEARQSDEPEERTEGTKYGHGTPLPAGGSLPSFVYKSRSKDAWIAGRPQVTSPTV